MNLLDTVRRQVRSYPGGIEVVALRLGKSASTLDKELRGAPGFKLGAEDAAEISAMCVEVGSEHAMTYATAVAAGMNCMLIPIPMGADATQTECMQTAAEVARRSANHVSEVFASLGDGVVSDNELDRVDAASSLYFAAHQNLRRVMGQINQAGKPASEVR